MSGSLAAAGLFGGALEGVKRLVASSPTFRNVVGAGSEDDAMRFIHAPEASDREGEEDPMPRAIVGIASFETRNSGSATWNSQGMIDLSFEFVPPSNLHNNRDDCYTWFVNQISGILTDMQTRSGHANEVLATGTYVNMRSAQLVEGPGQAIPDEEGGRLFYGVCFSIPWM
jgi:hypothetical protein